MAVITVAIVAVTVIRIPVRVISRTDINAERRVCRRDNRWRASRLINDLRGAIFRLRHDDRGRLADDHCRHWEGQWQAKTEPDMHSGMGGGSGSDSD